MSMSNVHILYSQCKRPVSLFWFCEEKLYISFPSDSISQQALISNHLFLTDDFLVLNIKSRITASATRQGFSPQGSDISISLWGGLYAEIAAFDAIVPYHPTATAIMVPVQKRLQNYSYTIGNYRETYSHGPSLTNTFYIYYKSTK